MENMLTNKELQDQDDEIVKSLFESQIIFDQKEKQYSVPLLFRNGEFPPKNLPTNYNLTLGRHKSLKAQIDRNPETRNNLADLCMNERNLNLSNLFLKMKLIQKHVITFPLF